eukprot:TRINITY_DN17345_c0_g1_i1.p1 TRINITY_DN17345_c0_g1~~TRINITY_DN17345_c0_g1_i1.p1  ORF type:complete len:239 (+),score=35.00 TRINITY_DN17345_c0_g1_i1:16-732(+)
MSHPRTIKVIHESKVEHLLATVIDKTVLGMLFSIPPQTIIGFTRQDGSTLLFAGSTLDLAPLPDTLLLLKAGQELSCWTQQAVRLPLEGGKMFPGSYYEANDVKVVTSVSGHATSLASLFLSNPFSLSTHDYWVAVTERPVEYLDFTFPQPTKLKEVRVCATCCWASNLDAEMGCNYRVLVEKDGRYVEKCKLVDTSQDTLGFVRRHVIQEVVSYVRLELHRTFQCLGLKMVEMWVVP